MFLLHTARKMACPALSSSVKEKAGRLWPSPPSWHRSRQEGSGSPAQRAQGSAAQAAVARISELPGVGETSPSQLPHPGAALRGGCPMCKGPTGVHLLGEALPSALGRAGSSPWVAARFPGAARITGRHATVVPYDPTGRQGFQSWLPMWFGESLPWIGVCCLEGTVSSTRGGRFSSRTFCQQRGCPVCLRSRGGGVCRADRGWDMGR